MRARPRSRDGRPGPVFRHFICRVSGLPADALAVLASPECTSLLDRLAALEAELGVAREAVSQGLHGAVQSAHDPAARRALLQLRRDLYNLRLPRPAVHSAALVVLGGEHADVDRLCDLLEARGRLGGELEAAYADAVRRARGSFREMLDDDGFQKGLLLSSRALFDAQARYRRGDGAADPRLEKTERGLLRYFARTAMKATPFGTLCSVVPGEIVPADGGPPVLELRGDPLAKRSATRLNKALFAPLMDRLLRRPGFRAHLPVELNPTLEEAEGRYVFLTPMRGKEVFVRLPRSATVDRVAELVRERPGRTLAAVVRALAAHPAIEASEAEAEKYLDALLSGGFLRFDTGVKEQDVDWDLSFRQVLSTVDDPHAGVAAELLARLRTLAGRYDAAAAPERRQVLEEARSATGRALAALGVRGFPHLPFMEDASADLVARLPDTAAFRELEACLAGFVGLLRHASFPRAEQAEVRHFFAAYYPPGTKTVPLLRFYEDFYREHEKPHLARVARRTGEDGGRYDPLNPFGLHLVDEIRRGQRQLAETVSRRWEAGADALEIDLDPEDFERAFAGVAPLPAEGHSLSVFAEVIPGPSPDIPLRLIVPGRVSVGYGRLFSRFVYLLPGVVQDELRRAAAAVSPGRTAEIGGDSGHNANLHPPLLEWELRYPTVQAGIAEHRIAPTELVVEPSPDDAHALVLRHAESGERVIPIDLGFTVRESRPPLYQLLCRFMPACEYQHRWPAYPGHLPLELHDREPEAAALSTSGEEAPRAGPAADAPPAPASASPDAPDAPLWARVVCRPRITFGGRLVLARRSWRVPAWHFPQREPWETELAFFQRADRWRRAHGIPREVYVRVWPEFLAGQAMGEIGSRRAAAGAGGAEMSGGEDSDGADEAGEEMDAAPQGAGGAARYARGTLNLRKPQYVDFGSPLLVSLLGRLVGDLDAFVAILEERYPLSDDLPRCGGRAYAVEQMFQLDFPLAPPDDGA